MDKTNKQNFKLPQDPLQRVIVAVDLETTGIDPSSDRIIEVGLVKFMGSSEMARFSTLVNPNTRISNFIRRLTGIEQKELDSAPDWDLVSPLISEFISSHPIVAHNVSFDAAFLRSYGINLIGHNYDTLEMARVILPEGPEYSLGKLSEKFAYQHSNPHRALSDALVTRDLFLELIRRFKELDPVTLGTLSRIGKQSEWSIGVLASQLLKTIPRIEDEKKYISPGVNLSNLGDKLTSRQEKTSDKESTNKGAKSVNITELMESTFSDNGALSRSLGNYESRVEQSTMAVEVSRAMEDGTHLIVEAGTGVGKSLAYLIPAATYALSHGRTVLISTNTINLQEQLFYKDLETVKIVLSEILPSNCDLKGSQLKGRSNYLCVRKWSQAIASGVVDERESTVLGKCLIWLDTTETGDRREISLGRDTGIFNRLSAQGAVGCPAEFPCFLRAARNTAALSDVIITNHAMVLSDIVMGGGLLPPHDVLVVDEAHHLQSVATKQLGFSVNHQILNAGLTSLVGDSGVISDFLKISQKQEDNKDIRNVASEAFNVSANTLDTAGILFPMLGHFISEQTRKSGGNDLRITNSTRELGIWDDIEMAIENFLSAADSLCGFLQRLITIDTRSDTNDDIPGGALQKLNESREFISKTADHIREVFQFPKNEFVYWLKNQRNGRVIEINGAPIEVGDMLKESLFDTERCVILTGATLSDEDSFNRLRNDLGLEESRDHIFGSPFDYKEASLVVIPDDIADPGGHGYAQDVVSAVAAIALRAQARILVLFTSHSALEAARRSLVKMLTPHDVRVVGQGYDGPPHRIMETLHRNSHVVALGTSSLWEGVDMSGVNLDVLIITRLPFPVPTEPIFSARAERFKDGFSEFYIPEATLKFRQGFGRLIRNKNDRGVCVILDRRIISKGYGRKFQRALPNVDIVKTSVSSLNDVISDWETEHKVQMKQ